MMLPTRTGGWPGSPFIDHSPPAACAVLSNAGRGECGPLVAEAADGRCRSGAD